MTKDISDFNVEMPINFYPSVLTARKIIETQENNELCISCFSNLAADNNLFVDILPISENRQVIVITNNDYLRGGENYQLRFAVQYE